MKALRRLSIATAISATLLAGTAGCTYLAPSATLESYNASDGVSLSSGAVTLNNALWVTANGKDAQLSGQISNNSDSEQTATLTFWSDGGKTSNKIAIPVAPHQAIQLGSTEAATVETDNLGVKAGANTHLYLQSGSSEGQKVSVPIMDGTFSEYASLIPSPSSSAIN